MLDLQLGERENYTLCQRSHFLSGGGRIRTMCDRENEIESRLARVVSEFYLQHNLEALTVNTATNMLDFLT